ncbi:MAG: histidine kinase [Bacteroidales bacterium]|nr:histidine kinase [Bacteroidales bacterium]
MKSRYKILIHVLFWIYMLNQAFFPVYLNKIDTKLLQDYIYLKDIFITTLLNIVVFYTVYFVIPKFLRLRRKWYVFPFVILLAVALSSVRLPIEIAYWKYLVKMPASQLQFQYEWLWATLKITVIISIYAMLIRFSIDWFESQKYKDELIKERQASEIALLRSQVNPHFLFNTLNNIYSLVYNKSDEAPEAVMKLSSIMRYMLYDSNTDVVAVNKEVEYLNSFIELQQLRITQKGFVEINVIGSMENRTIAPMLLIPFVENAFKHGEKNHIPGIIINLNLESEKLIFTVENYTKANSHIPNEESGGFGLENIKRRLGLLYPDKHELKINKSEEKFKIELIIQN